MSKSRRSYMKSALVAGGLALGATGVFLLSARDVNLPSSAPRPSLSAPQPVPAAQVIAEYNGPDDKDALQAMVAMESQSRFTMVMYHATWCPYCRKLTEQLQGAAEMTDTPYKVIKVDVEKFPGLAAAAKQSDGVPETFVFVNGQQVDHFGGAGNDTEMIAEYLRLLQERYPSAAVTKPFITAPTPFPKAH